MAKKKSKEQERRDQRKKTLILIFLFFLMGIVGTVTYAWFSSDMKLNIDAMDIHIETNAGIQVSINGINWGNEIKKEDIIDAYKTYPSATNQLPETLSGCSTDGSASGATMNMFHGVTREHKNEGYFLTASRQTEINCVGDEQCAGKHYIAFDVFILLNEPATLYVTGESYVRNKSDKIFGGENSARIGFVNLGTTTDTVDGQRAQYLANASGSVIWEPNYDTHTTHGIKNAADIYGITTTETGAARLSYKGINSEITGKGVAITATDTDPHFTTVNPKITTIKDFTNDQELDTFSKGITKLRIYFWLEGQDVDMENEVSGGELEFKLELAIQ